MVGPKQYDSLGLVPAAESALPRFFLSPTFSLSRKDVATSSSIVSSSGFDSTICPIMSRLVMTSLNLPLSYVVVLPTHSSLSFAILHIILFFSPVEDIFEVLIEALNCFLLRRLLIKSQREPSSCTANAPGENMGKGITKPSTRSTLKDTEVKKPMDIDNS